MRPSAKCGSIHLADWTFKKAFLLFLTKRVPPMAMGRARRMTLRPAPIAPWLKLFLLRL